jgi:hypothetical protein
MIAMPDSEPSALTTDIPPGRMMSDPTVNVERETSEIVAEEPVRSPIEAVETVMNLIEADATVRDEISTTPIVDRFAVIKSKSVVVEMILYVVIVLEFTIVIFPVFAEKTGGIEMIVEVTLPPPRACSTFWAEAGAASARIKPSSRLMVFSGNSRGLARPSYRRRVPR